MTVNAITDTKKGRTGIAPTYLHTTRALKVKTSQGLLIFSTGRPTWLIRWLIRR